jgi:hypothetical protein
MFCRPAFQSINQQNLLGQLDQIDLTQIDDPAAILTANFLRNQLESARDLAVCRMELWEVSPTWTGWMAELTGLAGKLEMDTGQQRHDALSRLEKIATLVAEEIMPTIGRYRDFLKNEYAETDPLDYRLLSQNISYANPSPWLQ